MRADFNTLEIPAQAPHKHQFSLFFITNNFIITPFSLLKNLFGNNYLIYSKDKEIKNFYRLLF